MLNVSQLKKGVIIKINNQPYIITTAEHSHVGRGGNILRAKLKNLITGATKDETFRGADSVEEADITKAIAQYLYADSNDLYFMDIATYEQISISRALGESAIPYLKEGLQAHILYFDQKPSAIELPPKVDLKVIATADAVRGNTAQGNVYKEATLETNAIFLVPSFIKEGDTIRINTDSGEYVERI